MENHQVKELSSEAKKKFSTIIDDDNIGILESILSFDNTFREYNNHDEILIDLCHKFSSEYNYSFDDTQADAVDIIQSLTFLDSPDKRNEKLETPKLKRQLTYNTDKTSAHEIDTSDSLVNFALNTWLVNNTDQSTVESKLMLNFFITLCLFGGHTFSLLLKRLATLRICDFTARKSILFPSIPLENTDDCSELRIPDYSLLILSKLINGRFNEPLANKIFYPDVTDIEERPILIRNHLKLLYKDLAQSYAHSSPGVKTPSFSKFFNSLTFLSMGKYGCPSFSTSILSMTKLPSSGYWNDYQTGFNFGTIPYPAYIPSDIDLVIEVKNHNPNKTVTLKDDKKRDLSFKALDLLSRFCERVETIQNNPNTKNGLKEFTIVLEKYYQEAENAGEEYSILKFIFKWALYRLQASNGNIKRIKTIPEYITIIITTLLNHDLAFNFFNLSCKQHSLLLEEAFSQKYTTTTLDKYLPLIKSFYLYLDKNSVLAKGTICVSLSAKPYHAKASYLTPAAFDKAIQYWHNTDNTNLNCLAIFAEMLFYIGDRSRVEAIAFQLSKISISGKLCDIYINESKTTQSTRHIAYHDFAPEEVVSRFISFVEKRRELYRGDLNFPLFGPVDSPASFSKDTLYTALLSGLKYLFKSKNITTHTLRHSFANHFLIRCFASIYPGILDQLPAEERAHPLFSEKSINKLKISLQGNFRNRYDQYTNTMLRHCAKILGHVDPMMMFNTYIHVFDLIQHVIYEDVNKIVNERHKLSRKQVSVLLPNMKSSATLSKKYDTDKTVSDYADEAMENYINLRSGS